MKHILILFSLLILGACNRVNYNYTNSYYTRQYNKTERSRAHTNVNMQKYRTEKIMTRKNKSLKHI